MSIIYREQHRTWKNRQWTFVASWVASAAMLFASICAASGVALADGGLESQKGGLFHRKGWIAPAIYRKKASKLGGPATGKLPASKRSDRRKRVSSKRRIPKRVIQQRQRKVAKSAGHSTKSKRNKRVRVASLGSAYVSAPQSGKKSAKTTKRVTGGGKSVQWAAPSGCVPGRLKAAINYVARNFGSVRVNSTCRSRRHNRRIGGARHSRHLTGQAADIRVFGNIRLAAKYLRSVVGGYKHYGGGLFHIDTGPRRRW